MNHEVKNTDNLIDFSCIKEWFPFYPSMWLSSEGVQACSLLEAGLLIKLMAKSWQDKTPGNVEINPKVLSKSNGVTVEEINLALENMAEMEVIVQNGKNIKIPRLEKIAEEQLEKHLKVVERGRKGGHKKAENKEKRDNK